MLMCCVACLIGALLGALSLGDIGPISPPEDPRLGRGRQPGMLLLEQVSAW